MDAYSCRRLLLRRDMNASSGLNNPWLNASSVSARIVAGSDRLWDLRMNFPFLEHFKSWIIRSILTNAQDRIFYKNGKKGMVHPRMAHCYILMWKCISYVQMQLIVLWKQAYKSYLENTNVIFTHTCLQIISRVNKCFFLYENAKKLIRLCYFLMEYLVKVPSFKTEDEFLRACHRR